MARLSTHVLDLAHGRPAQGMQIDLYQVGPGNQRTLVCQEHTNADGRTDAPLLSGQSITTGQYELLFHVAAYFASSGLTLSDPPFLDVVPVRFGLADPGGHYHVPLLVTPWGYQTYRGS